MTGRPADVRSSSEGPTSGKSSPQRGARPSAGEALVEALAERIGVPSERIQIAIRYCGEYPEAVDRFIALVEEEAERLERGTRAPI